MDSHECTGDCCPAAAQRLGRVPAWRGTDRRRRAENRHPTAGNEHGTGAAARGLRLLRTRDRERRSSRWSGGVDHCPRQDPAVKRAIDTIDDDAWTKIEYPNAIFDPDTDTWTSVAEVAEVPFTAFTSKPKKDRVEGRLVVRRIPELNKNKLSQPTLFDTHRFHAVFTTSTLDTVTADQVHRRHAIIEQVNADLKNSALAHLPSGIFTANAAWLVLAVIAFNLTHTAATITGAVHASATTATIRRKVVTIPARIASSARRIRLHLPEAWPWETAWSALFAHALAPPERR